MDSIHDVSWAPLVGRSFHMIVSSNAAGDVIVWRLEVRNIFDAPFEKPYD